MQSPQPLLDNRCPPSPHGRVHQSPSVKVRGMYPSSYRALLIASRTAKDSPTVHAFAHALSTVLVYIRESLADIASTDDPDLLTAIWSKYARFEDILAALTELYGRVSVAHSVSVTSLDTLS